MPQNRFGSYLSKFGVSFANAARRFLQACKNNLYAAAISYAPLWYVLLALYTCFLASLQVSSYHGANVLPHLLGLRGSVILYYFTAPTVMAS